MKTPPPRTVISLPRKKLLAAGVGGEPGGRHYVFVAGSDVDIAFAENQCTWAPWPSSAQVWAIPQFNPPGSTALRDLALDFLEEYGVSREAAIAEAASHTGGDLAACAERLGGLRWRLRLANACADFAAQFVAWLNGEPVDDPSTFDPAGPGMHDFIFRLPPAAVVTLTEDNGRLFIGQKAGPWLDVTGSYRGGAFAGDAQKIADNCYVVPLDADWTDLEPAGEEVAVWNEDKGLLVVRDSSGQSLAGPAALRYLGWTS